MQDYTIKIRNGKAYLNGNRELISSSDAAKMLNRSRARVSQLIEMDRLHSYQIGHVVFVLLDDVIAYGEGLEA